MAAGDLVDDDCHFTKYCGPTEYDKATREYFASAFAPTVGRSDLSGNWLEYFCSDWSIAIRRIQADLAALSSHGIRFTINRNGSFPIVEVGPVCVALAEHGYSITFVEDPYSVVNESHCEVHGFDCSRDQQLFIGSEIAELVLHRIPVGS